MSGQLMQLLSEVEDLIPAVRDADPPPPATAGRLQAALVEAEAAARAYLSGAQQSRLVKSGVYSTTGPAVLPDGLTRHSGMYSVYTPPALRR